jgi:hypothetical protein
MDGVEAQKFHDNTSYDQSTNLETITRWHNNTAFGGGHHNYDVSVHFNAYDGSAHGTEVLYVTQETLADTVCDAIVAAGGFTNRGAKYRSDLYVLNNTREPAILLETCFCDNTGDSNLYNDNFEDICMAIAESVTGQEAAQPPEERPPIEPPERPQDTVNYIELKTASTGGVHVLINGATMHGEPGDGHTVDITIVGHGDVSITINGEMFHNHPPTLPPEVPAAEFPSNQSNIICTVFGGDADGEYSAYGPYDAQGRGPYMNDTDDYVSLPWNVEDAGLYSDKRLKIRNSKNHSKVVVCTVADKGPWFNGTDGNDNYVDSGTRPYAEKLYFAGEPCPSGPNEGIIPNGAGIDISPHAASVLGIDGKGHVDWRWIESEEA